MTAEDWFTDGAAFDRLTARLWGPVSGATVARVAPAPGEVVLDACCGAGAAAVPAALAVGPTGRVDGVDLAPALLEVARARAEREGASAARFHGGDATAFGEEGGYDVVLCVLGVFFTPDPVATGRHLTTRLRPGGRLAVTSWRDTAFTALLPRLAAAAAEERGGTAQDHEADRHDEAGPHERQERLTGDRSDAPAPDLFTADGLLAWAEGLGGLVGAEVVEAPLTLRIDDALVDDLVDGSAGGCHLAGLDDAAAARVRRRVIEEVRGTTMDATALVLTARRDG